MFACLCVFMERRVFGELLFLLRVLSDIFYLVDFCFFLIIIVFSLSLLCLLYFFPQNLQLTFYLLFYCDPSIFLIAFSSLYSPSSSIHHSPPFTQLSISSSSTLTYVPLSLFPFIPSFLFLPSILTTFSAFLPPPSSPFFPPSLLPFSPSFYHLHFANPLN